MRNSFITVVFRQLEKGTVRSRLPRLGVWMKQSRVLLPVWFWMRASRGN